MEKENESIQNEQVEIELKSMGNDNDDEINPDALPNEMNAIDKDALEKKISSSNNSIDDDDKPIDDMIPDDEDSHTRRQRRIKEKLDKKSPPVILEWKNLEFSVSIKPGRNPFKRVKKQILYPITGYIAPGEVLAILGPSGAGKTTFLNLLTQVGEPTGGSITINRKKLKSSHKSLMAFVRQEDVLMGNLKVKECLRYAALLRLPTSISVPAKFKMVDELISDLGLNKCKNTQIGVPGLSKGISGGERKRLAIAMEMITNPSVLFLDEPTTGLDAKTALNIMQTISKIAQKGRTVVLTIHQPRSNIFSLFDKLLLLTRGRVAYFGKASEVPEYLESIGYPIPDRYNPADFLIDLVAEEASDTKMGQLIRKKDDARISYVLDTFQEKVESKEINTVEYPEDKERPVALPKRRWKYQSLWIFQLLVLTTRAFLNLARDKALTFARLFQTLFFAALLSFIFFRLDTDQTGIGDRIGALFFVSMNVSLNSLFSQVLAFGDEKPVFMRERSAKTYYVSSYVVAKGFAEIPFQVVFMFIFGSIIYYIVGFNPNAFRFFTFLLIVQMMGLTGQALGQLLAAIAPNQDVAIAIAPVVIVSLYLFGGFFINVDSIPVWFIWVYWISLFHYGFEALMLNEFEGQDFFCTQSQFIETSPGVSKCPITAGDQILTQYGMDKWYSNIWINVAVLLLLIIICRLLTFIALRFLKKPREGKSPYLVSLMRRIKGKIQKK